MDHPNTRIMTRIELLPSLISRKSETTSTAAIISFNVAVPVYLNMEVYS